MSDEKDTKPTVGLNEEETKQLTDMLKTLRANCMNISTSEANCGRNIAIGIITGATIIAKQMTGANELAQFKLEGLVQFINGMGEPLADLTSMIKGITEEQKQEKEAHSALDTLMQQLKQVKAKYEEAIAAAKSESPPEKEQPKDETTEE